MQNLVRTLGIALLAAAGSLALPLAAHAQPASTKLAPRVLERVQRDRWIHAGQHPGFVPFSSARHAIHIAASTYGGSMPGRSLVLKRQERGAQLSLHPTNRILSARVDQPPTPYREHQTARDAAESRRSVLRSYSSTALDLPYARFWEVPFVVPTVPLAPNVTWTDTLTFSAEHEGLFEELSGVWHGEVIGDTVLGGRTLPLVRTRADIRYRSRNLTTDHALDVLFEIEHDASGTLVGVAAIDTAYGVRAAGADTTFLTGTAWLRTGDGRSFSSPVRYERERTWLLHDSMAWVVRSDSLQAALRAQSSGMLGLPRTPAEERAAAGDEAVLDSLFGAWRDASDPDERAAVEFLLYRYGSRRPVADRMRAHRIQSGDTATLIARALGSSDEPGAYPANLIPYLDDMGRLWRLGIVPRYTYMGLAERLLRATPILQPDSARWDCGPVHCATIIALGDTPAEARLRDVALVGAFARDPARWYARVAARADSGSLSAREALRLAHGIAAAPGMPQVRLPAEGADWRAWLEWLGGTVESRRTRGDALRMYAARTGRDPLLELERRRAGEGSDSARAVFSAILHGMGRLPDPTSHELARLLTEGAEAAQATAREQLTGLLRRNGAPAPDSLAVALLGPMLDSVSRGSRAGAPWPASPRYGGGSERSVTLGGDFGGARDVPVFVLDQELPAAVRGALPPGYRLISRAEWDARPRREGGVLVTVPPVRQWEDFVEVGFSWTVLRPRAPDEAPSGYVGGRSFVLLRRAGGWVVVSGLAWAS